MIISNWSHEKSFFMRGDFLFAFAFRCYVMSWIYAFLIFWSKWICLFGDEEKLRKVYTGALFTVQYNFDMSMVEPKSSPRPKPVGGGGSETVIVISQRCSKCLKLFYLKLQRCSIRSNSLNPPCWLSGLVSCDFLFKGGAKKWLENNCKKDW